MAQVDQPAPEGSPPLAASRRLGPGDLISHYRIEREIGRGGMGTVYEVSHVRLSAKRFALKVLGASLASVPEAESRFLREAEVVSRLNHPHVVALVDFGQEAGTAYLVMEMLTGEDLATVIERGPMSAEATADIMLAVCSGVAEAHRLEIIHRDLKPQNIFLCRSAIGDTVPKVLDFGISKLLQKESPSTLTDASALLGTPHYLSPEQADGGPVTVHSDQYALGAILYECVTGRRCHDGPTLYAVLRSIATAEYASASTLVPHLSPGFEAVIAKAMSLDPAARFESVELLGRALLPFASKKGQAVWRDFYGGATEALAPTTPLRIAHVAVRADSSGSIVPARPEAPQAPTKLLTPSSQRGVHLSAKSNPRVRRPSYESLPPAGAPVQGTARWKVLAIGVGIGAVVAAVILAAVISGQPKRPSPTAVPKEIAGPSMQPVRPPGVPINSPAVVSPPPPVPAVVSSPAAPAVKGNSSSETGRSARKPGAKAKNKAGSRTTIRYSPDGLPIL